MGDELDRHQHHQKNVEKFLRDSPSASSLPSASALTKNLRIPVDELDFGSNLENDVQEHLNLVWAKRFSDPFCQWLPLACTRAERDEGLSFPPDLDRLWALIHREIDSDRPIISDVAASLVRERNRSLTASEYQELFRRQTYIGPYQCSCLDPISPPLSPVSDDTTPFIPDRDVAIIDLVSEPSSPNQKSIEAIQRDIDSEPVISSTFMTSSPTRELPQLCKTHNAIIEEAKLDVPVVLTSSDVPSDENIVTNIRLPLIGSLDEEAPNLLEERGHFEDAFMTLLDDRRYYANQLVNQERLDPADSISRIPVPLLDFDIQPPEWTLQHSTAKSHFVFLRKSMTSSFSLTATPRDPQSEISLRWSVFPLEKRQPIMKDEMNASDDTVEKYLSQDPVSRLSSMDYVSIKSELDVLCILEDEEIEEVCSLDDMVEVTPPVTVQPHGSTNRVSTMQQDTPTCVQDQDSTDLNRQLRRKLDEEPIRLLPVSYDTSATTILLHNFMELKGIKRPRLNTNLDAVCQPTDELPPRINNEAQGRNDYEELLPPAPSPTFEIPSEKALFIISVDLARPILRRLENAWTPENLIDMDYSRHNSMSWTPGAVKLKEIVSQLSFEADISLSPTTGIFITNLLRVKQRPLPGSQSQAPLRERVQKVSQRYQTLIVLVSESNPGGELMGTLAPSDAAAYADFITFTVALDGDVDVHLVPGAEATMASWILAFMSRYSYQAESLRKFLSPEETPWETILRRAGMNVVAARVLSKTLCDQGGSSGLAVFLMMPIQERIARYGHLLGGEKALRLTATALDRKWGS
ncbi:hypothetical protein TARUN_5708 [Trichoderma arundinaceum]|uniref:Uncharacterized protein n=1 Tax=Trichoderma arundinaceum TaxID=490622 RepID=A0A395NKT7_TRIAR|nr:hypothetical protein TARUN_5708 [Trichoderma arundinaceum]